MGLSITTVFGAAETDGRWRLGRVVPRPGWLAGIRGGRLDRGVAAAAGGEPDLRRPAPQADLDRAVGDVERGQVVALHQTNEVVDPLDIERLGRTGGVLRHSFTPH